VSNLYKKGKDTFNKGFYCAESVLKVIADEEGITSPLLPRIATGFCSGVSRTCNICGAVTGGILSLNMVFGRNSSDELVEKNYRAVPKFISGFKKEFGSINCQELIGCNLSTNEGKKMFSENKLYLKCSEYTGRATELARTIIINNKKT